VGGGGGGFFGGVGGRGEVGGGGGGGSLVGFFGVGLLCLWGRFGGSERSQTRCSVEERVVEVWFHFDLIFPSCSGSSLQGHRVFGPSIPHSERVLFVGCVGCGVRSLVLIFLPPPAFGL